MNILFIIGSIRGGGAEKVLSVIASQLSKRHNVIIAVDNRYDDEYPVDSKVNVLSLNRTKHSSLLGKVKEYLRKKNFLKKIKKTYDIDCSISFMGMSNHYNVITRSKEKVITSIRVSTLEHEKSKLNLWLNKYDGKKSDLVVAVSENVRQEEIKHFNVPEDKVVTIYNPCDIDCINEDIENASADDVILRLKANGYRIIANHGRLDTQKGQMHLLKVMKEVVQRDSKIALVIMGDGPLRAELEKYISENNLSENVFLLGRVFPPYRNLYECDLYVFTSYYEGFPNALLDALACGLPIISTDSKSGARELLAPDTDCEYVTDKIEPVQYGILIPRFDRNDTSGANQRGEEYLSKLILDTINNHKTIRHYAQVSLNRANDFTVEKIVMQWEDVLI